MAKFVVEIITEQELFPVTKLETSKEVYRLRDVCVLIASALVNRGIGAGDVTAVQGAVGSYRYVAKRAPMPRTTNGAELPPAA